jgi:hypothetical protein
MYQGRTPPANPPCETCRVDLREENEDAMFVYRLVNRQVVTRGMDGDIIDLNFQAVKTVMDLYEIKNQRTCFEKVRRIFFHFLDKEG